MAIQPETIPMTRRTRLQLSQKKRKDTHTDLIQPDTQIARNLQQKFISESLRSQLLLDEGTNCGKPDPSISKLRRIPSTVRLSKKPKTNIDLIKECVVKPDRSVPPTHLPLWRTLPLEQKLPAYDACDTIIYSRGELGQKLFQNYIKDKFTLEDPENHEITVPYNPLHDPATINYFDPPHVKRILKAQGLLTASEEVICSVKEFNTYRNYLKRLHNSEVHHVINNMDENHLRMREQEKKIKQEIDRRTQLQRKQQVLERKRQLRNQEFKAVQESQLKREVENFHLEQKQFDRAQVCIMKQMESETKRKLIYERAKNESQLKRERQVVETLAKEIQAEARKKQQIYIESQKKRLKKLEKLNQRYENQKRQVKYDEIIDKSIKFQMQQRSILHKEKVEKHRLQWPEVVAAKKRNNERLWGIVRKYFYIWLNKVRDRRAAEFQNKGMKSYWNVPQITEQTVKFLKKKSGYAGFDDFILNLIKLKQQMMQEQAEEEARKNQEVEEQDDENNFHPNEVLKEAWSKLVGQEGNESP